MRVTCHVVEKLLIFSWTSTVTIKIKCNWNFYKALYESFEKKKKRLYGPFKTNLLEILIFKKCISKDRSIFPEYHLLLNFSESINFLHIKFQNSCVANSIEIHIPKWRKLKLCCLPHGSDFVDQNQSIVSSLLEVLLALLSFLY